MSDMRHKKKALLVCNDNTLVRYTKKQLLRMKPGSVINILLSQYTNYRRLRSKYMATLLECDYLVRKNSMFKKRYGEK